MGLKNIPLTSINETYQLPRCFASPNFIGKRGEGNFEMVCQKSDRCDETSAF